MRYYQSITNISIHAPREGGDPFTTTSPEPSAIFQSTPPARGATGIPDPVYSLTLISIHAPREGGDSVPTTPPAQMSSFQSTPPARGAT